jgi:asparagine synthase (glutamine-hydrolysing)
MGLSYAPALWNPVWLGPVEPSLMKHLCHEALTPEELFSEALEVWDTGNAKSMVDRSLEFYTNFYLQDGILMKTDRASMMNSLETRSIFLDNDLVEFCRRLPHSFKLRNGRRKYLLKKAMQGILPANIIDRKKKGFGIPTAKWLQSMPAVPPLGLVEGMHMDRVGHAWDDHRRGTADNRLLLWSWLSLQSLGYTGYAVA